MGSLGGENGHATDFDVIVVGGGFGGCYSLYTFRKLGLRVHLIEAGSAFGGVWHWNSYPGARVDSEMPYYQLTIPEVWRTWSWSQRFPGHEELKRYFAHVDKTLGLARDTSFNTAVVGADFNADPAKQHWTISTDTGRQLTCKYFVPATGSSYRAHRPDFAGLDTFQGQVIHSASWPRDAMENLKGKDIAIVGAGATGVQCVQELSKIASKLTVYIRNPNIALPMGQRTISDLESRSQKAVYRSLFKISRQTGAGLACDACPFSYHEQTEAQRRDFFEELWARGGFSFQAANYRDFLTDMEANQAIYNFWAERTRGRIRDPAKREVVVPSEPPFPFATKRSSLEQDYYECLDKDHVHIVDLKRAPISAVTAHGVVTEDGKERCHDALVLATGYDNMTGSLTTMGVRGKDGVDLKKKWKEGVNTHLGIMTSGCPNMFMIYGPQAPTAFTNAPIFIEAQVEFVADLITKMRDEGVATLEPRAESEDAWKKTIQDINDATLFPMNKGSSWYLGTNIPGKKREQLNYLGGMDNYEVACREALRDWTPWEVGH